MGVCCELLLLTWPGMPASPPTPKSLGFWNKSVVLAPTLPLSAIAWPCLTSFGTCRGRVWALCQLIRSSVLSKDSSCCP